MQQVLGALHFLSKDYERAASHFSAALELCPENYSIWNRYGAVLANQGESLAAISAYNKALELRPGYVRAWANIGIAHSTLNEMNSAARFYLCALSLNPCAVRVWNYLVTAFVCMKRFDLVKKVQLFDVGAFRGEFDIVEYEELRGWAAEYNGLIDE